MMAAMTSRPVETWLSDLDGVQADSVGPVADLLVGV